MPTLAAGNSAGPARRSPRGFTLVELLVTLLVMALLTGLAALALPQSGQESMQREAERLAALLDAAREQAADRGEPLAWAPGSDGYTFLQPSPRGWIPLDNPPLTARAWQWLDARETVPPSYLPRSNTPTVQAGDVAVRASGGASGLGASPSWLVFGTEPVSAPMAVTLHGDGRVITIASDGLAPFAVQSAR
ncbi:MAG: prepilin-type N-terminal cleavage/methylation domain-containing protein [Proteobacteria bacterium]|nr:prepilin-type N-terminal cleavage/methylation domain-containing protein [Pseudomonadota bacterium]